LVARPELLLPFPPKGIHQLLRFARKAWVSEEGLASEEEKASFWDDVAPIWQVRAQKFSFPAVNRN